MFTHPHAHTRTHARSDFSFFFSHTIQQTGCVQKGRIADNFNSDIFYYLKQGWYDQRMIQAKEKNSCLSFGEPSPSINKVIKPCLVDHKRLSILSQSSFVLPPQKMSSPIWIQTHFKRLNHALSTEIGYKINNIPWNIHERNMTESNKKVIKPFLLNVLVCFISKNRFRVNL